MNCNEELFKLVQQDKLDENDEFEIRLKRNLPGCKRINALRPVAVSGDSVPDTYSRPKNRFECQRKGCVNTGTLFMDTANETATYHAAFDATEFAGGVVTFYVKADEVPTTVTFKIGNEEALTNANVYTRTITEVTDDGFAPVAILLSDVPDDTTGDGWTPSQVGAYIQVSADKVVGYSSFTILDKLSDFELNDVIKLRCVQSAGTDFSLSTIEEICTETTYDKNINSIPFSLSATKVSENYMKGNPMFGDGKNDIGFAPITVKKTVEAYTVDEQQYGRIILADANQDECGRIALQIIDECATDVLSELSIPTLIDVDAGHFVVINNDDGSTDIILNKSLIGKEVRVSYPQIKEVKETVISTDFLGETEASLYHHKKIGGKEYTVIYDNVLITTFPNTISRDSAVFNFGFNIIRDANGNFVRIQEIL